jgi:hypothetical protein
MVRETLTRFLSSGLHTPLQCSQSGFVYFSETDGGLFCIVLHVNRLIVISQMLKKGPLKIKKIKMVIVHYSMSVMYVHIASRVIFKIIQRPFRFYM